MLILTRRSGESFYVGDNVLVTILEITGDKARVAIEAPKEIVILRKELVDAQQLNKESLEANTETVAAFRKNLNK